MPALHFSPFLLCTFTPFWIYNQAFLIRLFSRIRSSVWILPILFPPFHDNTCSAGHDCEPETADTELKSSPPLSVFRPQNSSTTTSTEQQQISSQFLFPLHTTKYTFPAGLLLVSFMRYKTLRTWSECWLRAACWAGASVPNHILGAALIIVV